jgi:hypothetical protein
LPRDRRGAGPGHADIHACIAQLEAQRYDVTESEAELAQERPNSWLILAKQGRKAMKYFCGFRRHRAVFSFDIRLAKVFADENEIVATAFAGPELRLREAFAGAYALPATQPGGWVRNSARGSSTRR